MQKIFLSFRRSDRQSSRRALRNDAKYKSYFILMESGSYPRLIKDTVLTALSFARGEGFNLF